METPDDTITAKLPTFTLAVCLQQKVKTKIMYFSEPSVKVPSRYDFRNHVKTPPVIQVTYWSLGGHRHS